MTEDEELDVQERCGRLFDLFLRFERAFTRLAIDRLDTTDADAEAMAVIMERANSSAGCAFAHFMRHIKHERVMRRVSHAAEAVYEARRAAGMADGALSIEAVSEYRRMHGGES